MPFFLSTLFIWSFKNFFDYIVLILRCGSCTQKLMMRFICSKGVAAGRVREDASHSQIWKIDSSGTKTAKFVNEFSFLAFL